MIGTSGLLSIDGPMLAVTAYAFLGGWLLTLAGIVMCAIIAIRSGCKRGAAFVIALLSLSPIPYAFVWKLPLFDGVTSSDGAVIGIMVGLFVVVLAGPALAFYELISLGNTAGNRSTRGGEQPNAHS